MSAVAAVHPAPEPDARESRARADATLHVRLLDASSRGAWDAFVASSPDATFFHRSGWQAVIERAFGHRTHFMYVECEGKIEGILPLAELKTVLFGHSLVSLPFCVYGGIVADTVRAAELLDKAACELAAKLAVGHLEYRSRKAMHADWPSKPLYVTFRKSIDPDPEKNLNAIPRKQRAMVRKGIKAGLAARLDDGVASFYRAYSDSVHRLGTPVFSKRYFTILREEFAEDCEVLVIEHEGKLISSVMSFYFRDEVLPYYGGGLAAARNLAGNDFMYWELMRRAAERGIRVFDYGRSKLGTGSYDFKKNWGFEAEPLQYEYHLVRSRALPDHNPLNPKYQMFIKMWQRLPLPVANMLGPVIVRGIG